MVAGLMGALDGVLVAVSPSSGYKHGQVAIVLRE